MTIKQAQARANREGRAVWYADGTGGGWWVRPRRKR